MICEIDFSAAVSCKLLGLTVKNMLSFAKEVFFFNTYFFLVTQNNNTGNKPTRVLRDRRKILFQKTCVTNTRTGDEKHKNTTVWKTNSHLRFVSTFYEPYTEQNFLFLLYCHHHLRSLRVPIERIVLYYQYYAEK